MFDEVKFKVIRQGDNFRWVIATGSGWMLIKSEQPFTTQSGAEAGMKRFIKDMATDDLVCIFNGHGNGDDWNYIAYDETVVAYCCIPIIGGQVSYGGTRYNRGNCIKDMVELINKAKENYYKGD